MDNVARLEVPNRMRSNTVRMDIDDRRVVAIVLLQYGCSLKEIAETFTKDSIIGAAVVYIHKHIESILSGEDLEGKIPKLSTDPYKIKE